MEKYDDYRYVYDWTTNRTAYNKARKRRLDSSGEIHCSYCSYNKGENSKIKWYYIDENGKGRHPSWKLISKNRKQWMKKPYQIKNGYEVSWSGWNGDLKPIYSKPRRR